MGIRRDRLLVWQKFKTNAVPLRSQFRELLGR